MLRTSLLLFCVLVGIQAFASTSEVYFTSEFGERLMNGSTIRRAAPDMRVEASYYSSPLIEIQVPGTDEIRMTISAPLDEQFTAKTYDYVRDDRDNLPRGAGFNITIGHWTISNIQGKLRILELSYDHDRNIERLAFDFIINDDSFSYGKKALSGSVRFHSDLPLSTPVAIAPDPDPFNAAHSEITKQKWNFEIQKVTNSDGNFYITDYPPQPEVGIEVERMSIQFAVNYGGKEDQKMEFISEKGQVLKPGLYTDGWPGLADLSTCRGPCLKTINIREVGRDSTGKIVRFAADNFYGDEHSNKWYNWLRYHSDVPVPAIPFTQ